MNVIYRQVYMILITLLGGIGGGLMGAARVGFGLAKDRHLSQKDWDAIGTAFTWPLRRMVRSRMFPGISSD